MDAVRRSRFATNQMRAGPAPLASFEDLPSDELESPEDFSHGKSYIGNIDDESGSRDLQFATPDSLTISSQSTPRIESDFDSHFTLTPGDSYQGQSTSDLRTASLSSLSKEDSTLSIKQKKGSAVSLGTLETTEVEYTHRKSSWTDIFKSHNQNSAKTSSSTISQLGLNEKSSQRKSRTDYSKKKSETKSKDKGKFLSIFKKKSNKQTNSPVAADYILPNENLNPTEGLTDLPETAVTSKISNGKISKGKENESPVDKDQSQCQAPCEIQNDLGKVNSDRCDKIPDERRLSRKVINIPEKTVEKEYNILSLQAEEKKVDKVAKADNVQSIDNVQAIDTVQAADNVEAVDNVQVTDDVKDEIESSESELTFESKNVTTEEKKEDDFEAEILLPHDLSELEDEPVIELPVTFEVSKQIMIPSKQQRLEITTKPIDRPRSTTPINVAPLEAFIQSLSPTFDAKIDKIKLSLPGEQFLGRVKKESPKKSSMKSWTDFCERGLHSPRMYKRFDKDNQKNPFESSDGAPLSVNMQLGSENWAAFDSEFTTVDSNSFDDNFKADFGSDETTPQDLCKSYQYFESDFSFNPSSSEGDAGCASCFQLSSEFSDAQSTDQPVFPTVSTSCEGCSCECHSKQKSNIQSPEPCSNISTLGASKSISLVADDHF